MGKVCAWIVAGLAMLTLAADDKGVLVEIDGLKSRTPAEWKEERPSSQMRFKQFSLPAVGQDKEGAELTIFFFGPGQGGSAEDNIKRWKGFFRPPAGKEIDDVAKVEKMKVSNVDVTYLDVAGTYMFSAQPFNPNAKKTPKENFRMLGIVFESKMGPYFMRLTGPAATLAHYKKGFDEWLMGFK